MKDNLNRNQQQMEEAYTVFAEVYDLFMDNIPYDMWFTYLKELLQEQNVTGGIVAELGCGTGIMTRKLKSAGYDMIGIDSSEDMLEVARDKETEGILYLCQQMQQMELYGTVEAFVSVCDSMNYLLSEEDLLAVFKRANNYLEAGGCFIFDMKTQWYYEHTLGDRVITDNREEACYIWDNHYDTETGINEYLLTLFIQDEEDAEVFYREKEYHIQRAYKVDTIKELIEQAGMEVVAVYDAFTKEPPRKDSERLYFVAREGFQPGKYYG